MRETERQKRWAAGSITAYLCLVLILMLSLISGTIASVRNAHARVMTACAMEQGLYSLFAGYDRTLLGQYELFFYNGGDKSGVWKPETMSRKVAETAGEVLSPTASGMGILSGSLSGGQVTEVESQPWNLWNTAAFPEIKRRTGNRETSGGRTERLRGRGGFKTV